MEWKPLPGNRDHRRVHATRLSIDVDTRLTGDRVLERLAHLLAQRGAPDYQRSLTSADSGPEFTAKKVRTRLSEVGVKTLSIELASPWENGYREAFDGKLRNELLNMEIFDTLREAQVLVERWRKQYNTFRPHSSLG